MLYAMAQPSGAQGGASPLISFLPLILIFVIFYLLLILPQQRKQKEHKKLLDALQRGQDVITSGGIHGKITKVTETTVTIKVSEKCEITVDRSAVTRVNIR